jgi:hypothetical protein
MYNLKDIVVFDLDKSAQKTPQAAKLKLLVGQRIKVSVEQ